MSDRQRAALIFAAFGALAAVAVFGIMGTGPLPGEAVPMMVFATVAAGLMGWLLAHKLATPFRAFAIMTGAVVMLGAQIPFAVITAVYFGLQETGSLAGFGSAVALLIVGGWSVAAPFQTVAGAAAGWLLHTLAAHPED